MIPLRPELTPGSTVLLARDDRTIIDTQGEPVTRPTIGVELEYERVGTLRLPTGRIACADPSYFMFEPSIPKRTVPPGEYEAWTVRARTASGRQVNAYAVLVIEDRPAMRYIDLDVEQRIAVDHAAAAFMDATHVKSLERRFDGDARPVRECCENALEDTNAAIVELLDGAHAAVWDSGFGDGFYNAYWGQDERGRICNLVMDFKIIENGLLDPAIPGEPGKPLGHAHAEPTDAHQVPWWKFWRRSSK